MRVADNFWHAMAATQGQGEVDPSRIVRDVNKDCPVNTTLYTQDEFSVDKLFGLMTPMVSQGSRDSPCARAVPNLTECAADGTLQVREGCCSTACAGKMQQALVSSGRQCYREFIEVMCNSTEIRESISRVLFGAAKRCLGLQPSCELLSQPGDLLNASTVTAGAGNGSNITAATPPQEQLQQQQAKNGTGVAAGNSTGVAAGNSTGVAAGNSTGAAAGNSSSGSGTSAGSSNSRGSGSAIVGNSFGMNELAAALAAQEAAPYAAPDPFMPLVPRPVETASSAVVLATPEEIDEAAARRNGSRRAIVTSNTTGPTPMNSSKTASAANSTEPRTPPGAEGLAPPAGAAAAVDQDRAAPTPAAPAARAAASSSSTSLLIGHWSAGAAAAAMLLLTAVLS
uniref:Uncharacterized protein n=1 Tax=Tetradesmus obliquus TaxID=3088 RepID=A0A383V8Q5_TETOB